MTEIKPNKKRLSICPLEIYDSVVGERLRIGVKLSYSDELLKNIAAAVISDQFGLQSVDYARKRYLKNWKRHVDLNPDAFDLKTIRFLESCLEQLQKHLLANSHNLIYSEVQKICDMTRVAHSSPVLA